VISLPNASVELSDVSSDGTAAVGYAARSMFPVPRQTVAVQWDADAGLGFIFPGEMDGPNSDATGVSDEGRFVVGNLLERVENTVGDTELRVTVRYRRDGDTGEVFALGLPEEMGYLDRARADFVSDDGRIVHGGQVGFPIRWDAEGNPQHMPAKLGTFSPLLHDISGDGEVLLLSSWHENKKDRVFHIVEGDRLQRLPLPPTETFWGSFVMVLSADGSVAMGHLQDRGSGLVVRCGEDGAYTITDIDGSLEDRKAPQIAAVSNDGRTAVGSHVWFRRIEGEESDEGILGSGAASWIWFEDVGLVPIDEIITSNGLSPYPLEHICIYDASADLRVLVGSAEVAGEQRRVGVVLELDIDRLRADRFASVKE
jgi:uncharacterized membrane protein